MINFRIQNRVLPAVQTHLYHAVVSNAWLEPIQGCTRLLREAEHWVPKIDICRSAMQGQNIQI